MIGNLERGAAIVGRHFGLSSGWSWDSRLLGVTPGLRTVACYRFRCGTGRRPPLQVVGKFYASAAEGAHCFHAMTTVHRALAQLEQPVLAVPEPLHYDLDSRFLAQPWVEDLPFPSLVRGRGLAAGLRWAGRALAQLHRLPAPPLPAGDTTRHVQDLMHPSPADLALRLPALGLRIQALSEALSRIRAAAAVPLHRDFHLRQLFLGRRRVWLIDWDQYALGDPALDVGNFLVYLETHLEEGIEPAQAAFLEGYGAGRGDPLWRQLPAYRALTHLRMACKAFRLQRPDWRGRLERSLERAEALLHGAGP